MTTTYAVERLRTEVGELLARHSQARTLESFAGYADDPVGFMRDVLRCEPWEKQERMAEMLRDYPRSVVVSCNGCGKDFIAARMALWWVYARRGFVVLTGPTERQVKHILMREVRRAFAAAPELPGELYALELRVAPDVGMLAFTSTEADKLTGFHHPRLAIIITEAQGCEPEVYEAALSCATGGDNRVLSYGNPTRATGDFYRIAHADNWKRLTVSAAEHPNVVTGREEIPGAISREFIAAMAEEYGTDSPIYKSRVLAQFPEEGSVDALIKRSWIRDSNALHADPNFAERERAQEDFRVCLSVDISRYGSDRSVCAVFEGRYVAEMHEWSGKSTTESADRIIAIAKSWTRTQPGYGYHYAPKRHVPAITVDDVALGAGVTDSLREKGSRVTAFNGAHAATEPAKFANLRTQSYWAVREMLQDGKLALPAHEQLVEELMAHEFVIDTSGRIALLSKDIVRKQIGRSPDYSDAIAMGAAYISGASRRELIVARRGW